MNKTSNVNLVIFIICLASSLVPFMSSALNLALPDINRDLSIKATMSAWIPASYILSTAVLQIPCARIGDMFGRRKIFIGGIFIILLFSILSGLAHSGEELIIYRFLSGIGSAMVFGTSTAILMSAVPKDKRGWALGLLSATVYFSLAAGPFFGGLLTESFSWSSIFFVTAAISAIVLFGASFIIKEDWKIEGKERFDFIGAVAYAIGLSTLIFGFSVLPKGYGFLLVGVGVLVLLLFVLYEKKLTQPIFNVNILINNKVFRLSSLSSLINYSATFAVSFMLSLYLQYVRGLSPIDAGFILISQSIIQGLVSLGAGRLSDKVSPTVLATTGMSIIAVGLILLCFITETTSFYFIAVLLAMLGIGFGMFSSPNTNIIMSSVDEKNYGMASATTGTMRQTGQSFSMGVAMMAISLYIGNVEITSAVHSGLTQSLKTTFIVFAVLCLIGVYTSSIRNKK